MRNIIIALCVGALCAVCCASCVNPRPTIQDIDYEALYQDLLYPSVRITSLAGCGSGVIIAGANEHEYLILTAAHVAGNEAIADVELFDSTRPLPAFVVATDTGKDLALLRLVLINPQHQRFRRDAGGRSPRSGPPRASDRAGRPGPPTPGTLRSPRVPHDSARAPSGG